MAEETVDVVWDGTRLTKTLSEQHLRVRNTLADAAHEGDWDTVNRVLREDPSLANCVRLGGSSLFAPLHQAAYRNAALAVVEEIIRLGAWRTLENSRGERPIDVASRKGNRELLHQLEPELHWRVPDGILLSLERHFHDVINGRADKFVEEHALRLPSLRILLELQDPKMWFPVPGMYGGFSYKLAVDGVEPVLIAESWCRVVGGSGQRHRIESDGSKLVAEGFV